MSIEGTLERVSAIRQALADPALLVASKGAPTGGTATSEASPAAGGGGASFANALEQASSGLQAPSEYPSGSAAEELASLNAATAPGLSSAVGLPSAAGLPGATGMPSASGSSNATTGLAGVPTSLTPLSASYPQQSFDGVAGSTALSPTEGVAQRSTNPMVAIAESQIGQSEQPPGSNESPAIAEYRSATAGAAPGEPWCAYFASWVAREAGEPIGDLGQGIGAVSGIWSWAQSAGRAIANGPGVVPKPGDLIVFGDEHVGIVRGVLPSGQIETIEGNYENKVAANVRSASEATGYVSMN